jgi:hypothetical protein
VRSACDVNAGWAVAVGVGGRAHQMRSLCHRFLQLHLPSLLQVQGFPRVPIGWPECVQEPAQHDGDGVGSV